MFFKWLVLSILFCLVTGLLAAALPAPAKKLGLFSLVLGAIAGGGVRQLRDRLGKPAGRGDLMVALILAGLTELGRIAETYRQFLQYQQIRQQQLQNQIEEAGGLAGLVGSELAEQMQSGWFEFLSLRYASFTGPLQLDSAATSVILLIVEVALSMLGAALIWRYWPRLFPPASQVNSSDNNTTSA